MKIEQDDPRLTAYVLGELSPQETRQFDHAIAGDPALKLAVKEIERAQAELLSPRQQPLPPSLFPDATPH